MNNSKILIDSFRDDPSIIFPSPATAYPTTISKLRYDIDIEKFASEFEHIDTELLLDNHPMLDELNSSGLSIGRVFAFRMFIECLQSRR